MTGRVFKNDRISVERLRTMFTYDPLSGEIRWRWREERSDYWNRRFAGQIAGTLKKGYVQIGTAVDGQHIFLGGHRVAWALQYGSWPDADIDHFDGAKSNNTIVNLRQATHSENSAHKNELRGATPFKGVYFMTTRGRFAAQIKHQRQHTWLGLFETAQEAAAAYDAAAMRLHGAFAKTNASMGLL